MINTSLTVFEGEPGSHMNYWLPFTKMVLESLVQSKKSKNHLVFLLWGAFAQRQAAFVQKPHVTIMSAHPSPLSACRGFFGSKPFSTINSHLINPIKWA